MASADSCRCQPNNEIRRRWRHGSLCRPTSVQLEPGYVRLPLCCWFCLYGFLRLCTFTVIQRALPPLWLISVHFWCRLQDRSLNVDGDVHKYLDGILGSDCWVPSGHGNLSDQIPFVEDSEERRSGENICSHVVWWDYSIHDWLALLQSHLHFDRRLLPWVHLPAERRPVCVLPYRVCYTCPWYGGLCHLWDTRWGSWGKLRYKTKQQ